MYGVPLRTKIRRIIFHSKSNLFAVEVEYFEFEVEYIKIEVENMKFEVEYIKIEVENMKFEIERKCENQTRKGTEAANEYERSKYFFLNIHFVAMPQSRRSITMPKIIERLPTPSHDLLKQTFHVKLKFYP